MTRKEHLERLEHSVDLCRSCGKLAVYFSGGKRGCWCTGELVIWTYETLLQELKHEFQMETGVNLDESCPTCGMRL